MHKSKTISSIIITGLLFAALLFLSFLQTRAEAVNDAVAYLQAKESSPWITMALTAAGQSPDVSYLASVTSSSAIELAAPMLALAAAGKDPRTFPDEDLVAKLKSFSDGTQIGDVSTLNDDIFGLLALLAAGESLNDPIIVQIKSYILSNQNEDGGWSFAVGGSSDTNMTAMAVMALVEAGAASSDAVIQDALLYLSSAQNEDGGFPYDPQSPYGTNSDTSSDAWVISALYKVGEDPQSWTKGTNTPISHLLSLQTSEGWFDDGFGENSFTPLSTSYAVMALSGKSYPVGTVSLIPQAGVQVSFRIEGSAQQICSGSVQAVSALDVVKNAAEECGYAYNIDDTDFGPYLSALGIDEAAGLIGWLYLVNWSSPSIGAGDYNLTEGDEVLWYYGDFAWLTLRLSFTGGKDVYLTGETLQGMIESYDGSVWAGVEGAEVLIAGDTLFTDSIGGFEKTLSTSGSFEIRAQKEEYVRSNVLIATVGDTVQEIELSIEITEGGGAPQIPEVGFSVSSSTVPFGQVSPGGSVTGQVIITNEGLKDLKVKALVQGDEAFYFLQLNNVLWSLFETLLLSQAQQSVGLTLSFPSEFSSFGQKQGTLIFWGVPQ